jgi:hypothetical protein
VKSVVVTGAKLVLYVNGEVLGRVSEMSWSVETSHRRAYGLDSLTPAELIPQSTRVHGVIRLIKTARDGGAEGAGLTAPIPDLSRVKYCALMLVDRDTDTVVFRVDRAFVESQGWSAPSRGVVTGTVAFEGMDWGNEVQPVRGGL